MLEYIDGITGNEVADELARKGATKSFTDPDIFCALPKSAQGQILRASETGQRKFYWKNHPELKQTIRPF